MCPVECPGPKGESNMANYGNVNGFYGQGMNPGTYNLQCPTVPCGRYPSTGGINVPPLSQIPCKECGMMYNVPSVFPNQNVQMNNYGAMPYPAGYYPAAGGRPLPSCMTAPQQEELENPPQNVEKAEEPAPDGSPVQVCGAEAVDENKEVFVLRIGKKKEGSSKSPKLELEMCTPRGKELKPIPKKETRDTQYDPADVPVEVKKGKAGKAGKGKGKGKGAGKQQKGKKKKK